MNRIGRTTIYAIPVIVVLLLTWQFSWIALKAASVNRWASWVCCHGVAGTLYFGPGGVFYWTGGIRHARRVNLANL
jgi:hypothetical protein